MDGNCGVHDTLENACEGCQRGQMGLHFAGADRGNCLEDRDA